MPQPGAGSENFDIEVLFCLSVTVGLTNVKKPHDKRAVQ